MSQQKPRFVFGWGGASAYNEGMKKTTAEQLSDLHVALTELGGAIKDAIYPELAKISAWIDRRIWRIK